MEILYLQIKHLKGIKRIEVEKIETKWNNIRVYECKNK